VVYFVFGVRFVGCRDVIECLFSVVFIEVWFRVGVLQWQPLAMH